jgi:hypothetical protein
MATAQRFVSVSIDVDPVPCYYRIHGLGPAPSELRDVVMRRCVPRFAELLARRRIAATFFIVGEDAEPRGHRALLAELVVAGHELGNHSHTHPYEMARLGPEAVAREIGACDDALRAIAKRPIVGFRAPGYDLSPVMLAELARRGYAYDSSIFPAPGYYALKAAVMAGYAAAGRPSGAVLTDPRALLAPAVPYRPAMDAPWRRGQAPLVELPIAVTPWLRAPAIDTSLLNAPGWLRDRIVGAMDRRRFFNLELHGLDLCGADEDGIPGELVARQPDLQRPLPDKLAALDAILERALRRFEPVPLRDAASWAHRELA